jgi:hypothetical protein
MRRLALLAVLSSSLAARADATFAIAPLEHWQNQGSGSGPVHLMVGDARLDAKPGEWASMTVPAGGRELVSGSVWIGSRALRPTFFFDVEDHHRYSVHSDPCCFFQLDDGDARFIRLARCGGADERCPRGLAEVDKFVYRKDGCGRRLTCAPPASLRVENGAADIAFDGGEPRAFAAEYQPLDSGRDSPVELTITPRGGPPLVAWALFRRASRYTLILGAAPRILRDP